MNVDTGHIYKTMQDIEDAKARGENLIMIDPELEDELNAQQSVTDKVELAQKIAFRNIVNAYRK